MRRAQFRQLGLLAHSVSMELRAIYAGSVLGVFWAYAGPMIFMVLYALMYGLVLRVQPPSMSFAVYVLYVASGLIPFLSFVAAISAGAPSLSTDRQILLNSVYPSEFIGVRVVLVQSVSLISGLGIAIVAAVATGATGRLVILVPLIVACQVLFTIGVVWILSLVALAFRDVQHGIPYVMFALLLVTPIGYDRALMPPLLEWLMHANPLFYFVTCYQDLIALNQLPPVPRLAVTVTGSIAVFAVSYVVYQRAKGVFYDYA